MTLPKRMLDDDTSIFPPKTRCEFCDYIPKCDLDVSRHLISPEHLRKKDNYKSLLSNQDKVVEKQIPKNLAEVFKSLKIRTVKDLNDLADKDYFKLEDESSISVAEGLANMLLRSVIEYETKELPPDIRKQFTEIAQESEDQEKITSTDNSTTQSRGQVRAGSNKLNQTSSHEPRRSPTLARTGTSTSVPPRSQQDPCTTNPSKRNDLNKAVPKPARVRPVAPPVQQQEVAKRATIPPKSKPPAPTPSSTSAPLIRPPVTTTLRAQPQVLKQNVATPATSSASKLINHKPQPREDSNYIPKLAIIKIEPSEQEK